MTTIERSSTVSAWKLAVAFSATALLVCVLFATPVGQAAGRLVLATNSVGTAQLEKNAVTSAYPDLPFALIVVC
jgi:cytochrome bd-type quinol oxidase subunit 1